MGASRRLFSLKQREADYFECLVLYTQGKTHEEKKRYFEKMIAFLEINIRMFNPDQYQFFQKWYYTAIHVLLDTFRFRGDYKALGRKLSPPISAEQARGAMDRFPRASRNFSALTLSLTAESRLYRCDPWSSCKGRARCPRPPRGIP